MSVEHINKASCPYCNSTDVLEGIPPQGSDWARKCNGCGSFWGHGPAYSWSYSTEEITQLKEAGRPAAWYDFGDDPAPFDQMLPCIQRENLAHAVMGLIGEEIAHVKVIKPCHASDKKLTVTGRSGLKYMVEVRQLDVD